MKYVIIGNSAAGINAVEAIREKDKTGMITVVSDENYSVYGRCLISYYLAGVRSEEELFLRPKDFYERMHVEPVLGKKVIGVNSLRKKILLEDNKEIDFDKLLIATGASAKSLSIDTEDKRGVFKFRTLDDAKALLDISKKAKRVVILGGGLIGLKAAYGLMSRGLNVKVIIKSDILMSQVIDEGASRILRRHLEKNGIEIMTGVAAKKIIGTDRVEGVILDNGKELKCEVIVVGKGVSPNIELLRDFGIKTREGVLTNEYLETNVKDIFAAGDCAETYDLTLEENAINALWTTASRQGRIAGFNMTGERRIYEGSIAENAVEFFGLPVISLGLHRIPRKNFQVYEEIIRNHPEKPNYKKIILQDNKLVGVVNVGTFKNAGVYLSLIIEKIDIRQIKHLLLEDNFNYAWIRDLIPEKEELMSRAVSIDGKFV